MADSLYWHDYETFGVNPAKDRPAQFAGIGITPQIAWQKGVCEAEFIGKILRDFSRPGTCVCGYNNLRFDDEVTRHTLYRNLHDPYAREWQQGNSRWDLIDLVRTVYALGDESQVEKVHWPRREDGSPVFRLDRLTRANGIKHESAHDALADVRATIAIARLLHRVQPRLFDYLLKLRFKRALQDLLKRSAGQPLLHISSKFPAQRGCASWVFPLARHPESPNTVICFDLTVDPEPLLTLPVEELRGYLFSPRKELADNAPKVGLKGVHLNRCPVLMAASALRPARAEALGINPGDCRRHLDRLRQAAEKADAVAKKVVDIFTGPRKKEVADPDLMLYSGGFFSEADRRQMQAVHQNSQASLLGYAPTFEDARLPEMLYRYKARNFPDQLTHQERQRWQAFRFQRLQSGDGTSLTFEQFRYRLEELARQKQGHEHSWRILEQLEAYADSLQQGL
jgi:exodeoxyribonuclease-1